ncbi:MAG: hypothetical protein ABSD77_01300 [Verrucomicrobiota bacterium]
MKISAPQNAPACAEKQVANSEKSRTRTWIILRRGEKEMESLDGGGFSGALRIKPLAGIVSTGFQSGLCSGS